MQKIGPGIWQGNWKCGKWETHTVGREIWRGKLKMLENKNCPLEDMEYIKKSENHGKWKTHMEDLKNDEITENREKWEKHTVGHGIWEDNWFCGKWETQTVGCEIWRGKLKKLENDNGNSRTWNMARKLEIMENEKHTLEDLKNNEITKRREKWKMHIVGPGIWREKWKLRKMRITLFR